MFQNLLLSKTDIQMKTEKDSKMMQKRPRSFEKWSLGNHLLQVVLGP